MLLSVLINKTIERGKKLKNGIGNGLKTREVILLMKIVMVGQIVKRESLIKTLNYSWNLKELLMNQMKNSWRLYRIMIFVVEEITQLKVCLEEDKIAIDTLKKQLIKKEKHSEKLECEIVNLRKELEKIEILNLRFAKGSETLDEIIKVQHSPLMKIGLGYSGEKSETENPSTIT